MTGLTWSDRFANGPASPAAALAELTSWTISARSNAMAASARTFAVGKRRGLHRLVGEVAIGTADLQALQSYTQREISVPVVTISNWRPSTYFTGVPLSSV